MIEIDSPGGYDKLKFKPLSSGQYTCGANIKYREIAEEDLVTVTSCASGVNYADVCVRWGLYESAKKYVGWPITPGFEFSGTIIDKGSNVDELKCGQHVFGLTMFGGYSEVIKVPKNQVYPIPKNLDMKTAAGFPVVAITAWYAMFDLAQPRAGSWILVHSAAGGVGSMLVQMAKIAKCNVVAVVGSSHKVEIVKENLGCDNIIDKSKEDLWSSAEKFSPNGYHVIFDANGVATLNESYKHLAPMGKLVVYGFHTMLPKSSESSAGAISLWQWLKIFWNYLWTPRFNPMKMTSENKSIMGFNLSFLFDQTEILQEAMSQLLSWVENGSLSVCKVQEYPLKNAGKAHSDLESGKTVGKLILTSEEYESHHSKDD